MARADPLQPAPYRGIVGHVGDVHVDALSGELLDMEASRKQIEAQAKALAAAAPPFQPYTKVPRAYLGWGEFERGKSDMVSEVSTPSLNQWR